MADATISLDDRARDLIADFQHAADSNSPISLTMMAELKDVLAIGVAASAKVAAIVARVGSASDLGKHVQEEVGDLLASIGQVSDT